MNSEQDFRADVLAIAAHRDDVEQTCGGPLRRSVASRCRTRFLDAATKNNLAPPIEMARVIRQLRPRVVILPYWQARHPDHAICASLGYEACFISGLAKIEQGTQPHRPFT